MVRKLLMTAGVGALVAMARLWRTARRGVILGRWVPSACASARCTGLERVREPDRRRSRSERSLLAHPSAVVEADERRAACLVCRRGCCRRRVVLRGRARWSSPGVLAWDCDGAVAACGSRNRGARDPGAWHLAGNRDWRFVGGRFLDAVLDGAGSDGREHARGCRGGGSVSPAGGAADRSRAGLGRARTGRVRRDRNADQCCLRCRVAEARQCDQGGGVRQRLSDLVARRSLWCAGLRSARSRLGGSSVEGAPAGEAVGGSLPACGSDRSDRGAVAVRRPVYRVSASDLGSASLRPSGRCYCGSDHLLLDGVEHGARVGAVRPAIAHAQRAREPIVRRRRGVDVTRARSRHCRAIGESACAGGTHGRAGGVAEDRDTCRE